MQDRKSADEGHMRRHFRCYPTGSHKRLCQERKGKGQGGGATKNHRELNLHLAEIRIITFRIS